jgi:hypothetical protein
MDEEFGLFAPNSSTARLAEQHRRPKRIGLIATLGYSAIFALIAGATNYKNSCGRIDQLSR